MSYSDILRSFERATQTIRELERSRQSIQDFLDEPRKPEVREAFLIVARHGWYLGPHMAPRAIMEAAEAIRAGNINVVDRDFTVAFDVEADQLIGKLGAWYPLRERILAKALDAHRRSDYELSVPVFLAQADGMCHDLTAYPLFGTRTEKGNVKVRQTAAVVEAFEREAPHLPFRRAMLEPFAHLLPIAASAAERGDSPGDLNRHAILHGESTDYGSLVNSAKALSLLYASGWVLRQFVSNDAEERPAAE